MRFEDALRLAQWTRHGRSAARRKVTISALWGYRYVSLESANGMSSVLYAHARLFPSLLSGSVNTAARMESTGETDRIQMSQSTADLLREAGKGHWLKARESLVHAKGKGELQTYWFEPTNSRRSIGSVCSEDSTSTRASGKRSVIWGEDNGGILPDVKVQRNKHLRLINYTVDLMAQILKQVVARRKMMEMAGYAIKDEGPPTYREYCGEGPTVLDEVVEVIKLPKFDRKMFTQYVDPDSIELKPEVLAQLKRCKSLECSILSVHDF